MALYGYPTVTLKDKDTGKIKKIISCKNIQTIPARLMFSGRYWNGINTNIRNSSYSQTYFGVGNYMQSWSTTYTNQNFVLTLPYRMPKTPYFAMSHYRFDDSNNAMADGQRPVSYPDVTGIDNVRIEQDSEGRNVIIYRGVLYAPDSGIRKIGTIGLRMSNNQILFYTPLDEIIDQDSATVIDITYKIIISGDNTRDYIYNYYGFYAGKSRDLNNRGYIGSFDNRADTRKLNSAVLYNKGDIKGGEDSIISGIYSGITNEQYNTLYPKTILHYSPEANFYPGGIGSPSYRLLITKSDMRKCGTFIGSLGYSTNRSLTPDDIAKVSNKKGVGVTFSKRRDSMASAVKPFFDASSIKKGDGAIKAISATERKGLPERWEIDVTKGGTLSTAEFRVRKTLVSGYEFNTNISYPMQVDHLSYEGAIGSLVYPKYNHPDGRLYESSHAVWPLYGQNIAIVIRKGVLLTSIGNARYIILDETNLPHENRGIQITGIAWDDSKKGLLIGCGESGLYHVDFDNDTDNEPTVRRITKDGIERVYAISGNGKGKVAIVTDAGIMHSDNLGETWNTKTFEVVKSQLSGVNSYTDSTDYVDLLKHKIYCFLLSRDGNSVTIESDVKDYHGDYLPKIELSTSNKATKVRIGNGYYIGANVKISDTEGSENLKLKPICISQALAEKEKSTIKELVSSDKYALQPNSCIWANSDGGISYAVGDWINVANGNISNYGDISIDDETNNQANSFRYRQRTSDGSVISFDKAIIHNGRWGLALEEGETGKVKVYIVGAALHHTKDLPSLFSYYNSTNNRFEQGDNSLIYRPTSEDVEIDGVKLKFSGDMFEAGDCFIFHRTMSYIDDNVSTMSATMEKTALRKSDWIEKSGTISEEMPKPIYRHPICTITNMYKTRDGRLKTKDRTCTNTRATEYQSPQYRVSGGAKLNFNLSRLKGGFVILISDGYGESYSRDMCIYLVKNGDDILYYCATDIGYYGILLGNEKLTTTNLSIVIDREKRGVIVNDGNRAIWTSGSSSADTPQTYEVRILPVNLAMKNGNPFIYNTTDYGGHEGIVAINDEAEISLPTFEYGYRGALCTELGNSAAGTGIYDPVFYGTPGIITDDSMIIEIDGKPAKAIYYYQNLDSVGLYGDYSPLKTEKPSRGGVSAKLTAGQVKIDSYMGIVYFSDEDIGKPYRIRYKYYKGDSLGIGEEIIE